ncbi:MAG: signal peptide peptidase SppA [Nannocystis sp.]|nr:signal peptide peptidase SppA [Nannocystis sp.]MBA3546625.1 signal peptide peptidase SppA [Nannocystis sp.]
MSDRPPRRRLITFLAVVGGITTALLLLIVILASIRCAIGDETVPDRTVLEIDFERRFVEHTSDDPLARILGGRDAQVGELIAALERARTDDRVVGLVGHIGAGDYGLAITQELRDAVQAFRASGKFAVAFSETFGEFGPGNQGYYLAAAFDEIWLQPSGDLGLNGIAAQTRFLRGAFDKLDVDLRMDHRHEYKNAMNSYTERSYTPAHREALAAVLGSMHGQLVRGVAEGRGLAPAAVTALIDRGPFLGPEALQERLVDRLGYRDELIAHVKEKAGSGAELLFHDRYLERAGKLHQEGARIAVVYGIGPVTRGANSFDPLFGGGPSMGSKTVAGALREAIDDPEVAAIIFRVDSPGGSYVASDTIWRETVRAKTLGKPLIVSMGNVAGSGGYFVAMHAAKIVAQPGTITGSIGVLGGKLLTRKLFEKLGVTYDTIKTAGNADMYSDIDDFSAHGWQRFQGWLDRVYVDFTNKVADGRGLPLEKVQQIAKGRIWSGEDAQKIGLVDELGGWAVATRLAREAAGIAADAEIELRTYPAEKSLFQQLLGDKPDNSEAVADVRAQIGLIEQLRPVSAELRALGLGPGTPGALGMPDITVAP